MKQAARGFCSSENRLIYLQLVAARRYRLEEAAESSAAARAAVRSTRELSLLLAGSQLGITLCTLALGAITKPAVHHMLTPLMEGMGVPATSADIVAFVPSLIIVTFLHLVIGEMAPSPGPSPTRRNPRPCSRSPCAGSCGSPGPR